MFSFMQVGSAAASLAAVIIGYFGSRARVAWKGALAAVAGTVGFAWAWYWVSTIIVDRQFNYGEQNGWDLAVTIYWSCFAVPATLVAFLVARRLRSSRSS